MARSEQKGGWRAGAVLKGTACDLDEVVHWDGDGRSSLDWCEREQGGTRRLLGHDGKVPHLDRGDGLAAQTYVENINLVRF